MRRFNLRERWRARTYTPLVLVPWVWALLIVLYLLIGFNACGITELTPTSFSTSDTLDGTDALIFWATMLGGGAVAFARRRTRRGGLRSLGWTVHAPGMRVFDRRFTTFPIGSHRPFTRLRLTQVATGTHRGSICASFSVWPRPQVIRRFYDVDLVELPLVLPTLALFPERQYDKVAAALSGNDIVTESDAFNRRWRVVGNDKRYTLALLHPLMMEMLEHPDFDDMTISIDGGAIMTWKPGRFKMADLGDRLDRLRAVAQSIPKHVWDDFGKARDPEWGPSGTLGEGPTHKPQASPSSPGTQPLRPGIVVYGLPPAIARVAYELGIPITSASGSDSQDPGTGKVDTGQTFFPESLPPPEKS